MSGDIPRSFPTPDGESVPVDDVRLIALTLLDDDQWFRELPAANKDSLSEPCHESNQAEHGRELARAVRSLPEVLFEVQTERERAHAKHQDTSMEAFPADDLNRLAILDEETGEVAKEFNEARHDGRRVDLVKLRNELIQVAAMAMAWADACGQTADAEPF